MILFVILGLFPDFVLAQKAAAAPLGQSQPPSFGVDSLVARMSLDEKVGQLLMIGFPQPTLDEKLSRHIRRIHASSFILFKRNIVNLGQVAVLNNSLTVLVSQNLQVAPLIAVDQEGGSVARIATQPSVPTSFAVGLAGNPELAHELGLEVGKILRTYGFNMNLAPVLDLTDLKKTNFIGLRSFSDLSSVTAALGTEYSRGLVESGVLPTAKHFPGMTSISLDPHQELISSSRSSDQFRKVDVVPYLKYFELGPMTAVMMSHLIYPSLDPAKIPAIYSRKISHDLLREELGYQGLVITDDIQMRSGSSTKKTWTNAIDSLKAGADLLILSWSFRDQEKTFFEIKRSVEQGILPIQEIDAKVKRILTVKIKFSENRNPVHITNSLARTHYSAKLEELTQKILDANLENSVVNLKDSVLNGGVCVYSSNRGFSNSFNQEKKLPFRLFTLKQQTEPKTLARHLDQNKCELNLIPIFGRLTSNILSEIRDPQQIKKTYVINFAHPSLLADLWPQQQTIQLGHPYANSGVSLARSLVKIRNSRLRAANQPGLERLPAEQSPNSDRSKTR